MSRRDPKVTLRQIADHAQWAQKLCAENQLAEILADRNKRLAFERIMEILGEAVKRLPPELCQRYPAVAWRLVAGMRDRVSHGYDVVDYGTLWKTVEKDVPVLIATVEQMLKDLEKSAPE
jgi:uncharacterized protein with HEPN domain